MSESRVRENRTHGSIGGRWRQRRQRRDWRETLGPASGTARTTAKPAAYLTASLHPVAVELDVGSGRGQHGHADTGRPLEEATKIVAMGVKVSAAVASKERSRSQLRLIELTVRVQR
jgi:hypothetical protein